MIRNQILWKLKSLDQFLNAVVRVRQFSYHRPPDIMRNQLENAGRGQGYCIHCALSNPSKLFASNYFDRIVTECAQKSKNDGRNCMEIRGHRGSEEGYTDSQRL